MDNSHQIKCTDSSGSRWLDDTIYPFFNCRKLVPYDNDNDDNDVCSRDRKS